jgi:hypothetical protein
VWPGNHDEVSQACVGLLARLQLKVGIVVIVDVIVDLTGD